MKKKIDSSNKIRFRTFLSFLFPFLVTTQITQVNAVSFEKGEKIFANNCMVCHAGGNNIIIPEKNLKKETLEANGMNTKKAIAYQVLNGKNGMPAFGGRLKENDIEAVATYVLEQSNRNQWLQKSIF
jgi:cytochrome c6